MRLQEDWLGGEYLKFLGLLCKFEGNKGFLFTCVPLIN